MTELAMRVWEGALALELVRATVLLAFVFGAVALLRRTSAATRHLTWSVGVVALLALPLLSAATPWRWDPVRRPAAAAPLEQVVENRAFENVGQVQVERSETRADPGDALAGTPVIDQRAFTLGGAEALLLLVGLWAAGMIVAVARLFAGIWAVRRVARRAQSLSGPTWTRPLFEAADRLGLRDVPQLLISDTASMPFVAGVIRPAVVVPAAAREWSEDRRRAVLLHELAHVRRQDLAVNLAGRLACAVWWFHPLVRIAAKRMRLESERACDDLVLRVGTLPSTYADHLLQIVRGAGQARMPAIALPMAQRSEFEGRMLAILEPNAPREPARRRHAALAAAAALLIALPLAAVGPERATAVEPPVMEAQAPDPEPRLEPVTSEAAPVKHTDPESEPPAVADAGDALDSIEIEDEEASGRTEAVETQDTTVIQALRAALRDASEEVREEAAWALGSMRATPAIADLSAVIRTDASPDVREIALWSLVQMDASAARADIEGVLGSDADAEVRAMAAWALGQFDSEESLGALEAALTDDDEDVRNSVAWALGTIRPSSAPAGLIRALDDESGEVREHAAWALGQIGDPAALEGLLRQIGDEDAGEAAIWAIGSIGGEEARPALIEALRSGNDEVRAAAARALSGRGGHPWPWPWPRPMPRI